MEGDGTSGGLSLEVRGNVSETKGRHLESVSGDGVEIDSETDS